jgi:hypothetical protein
VLAFEGRVACGMILLCVVPVFGQSANQPVEPNAGAWKTWVISSGKDYRVPPPPDAASTQNELAWLRDVVLEPNPYIADGVRFWSAGAPAYQWFELITKRILSGAPVTGFPHRVYTYVALAMYDATVAAWESKYFYNRPRPSQLDPTRRRDCLLPVVPPTPPNTLPRQRLPQPYSPTSFPTKPPHFSRWQKKLAKRSYMPGWHFRPTISREWTLGERWRSA